jgi:O-antigen/teichoic acid export membrane protein
MSLRPRFSVATVKYVWRFAATMNLIAIISVFLTQADRFVVSKLLGLESLGYYSLAYNTAIGISLIPIAIKRYNTRIFCSVRPR